MADISKCPGGNCPLKEKCYRFKAPSSLLQSYFCEVPDYTDEKCKYYWPIREGD